MAHLEISEAKVRLNFSVLEMLGAFAKSPEVSIDQVESVEIVDDPWSNRVLRGVRAPGTGIPLIVMLGTLRYPGGKDLCAIYKRRPTAIVRLKSGPFKRWIFEIKDMSEIDALTVAIRQG